MPNKWTGLMEMGVCNAARGRVEGVGAERLDGRSEYMSHVDSACCAKSTALFHPAPGVQRSTQRGGSGLGASAATVAIVDVAELFTDA